jgi:hypothetical protein
LDDHRRRRRDHYRAGGTLAVLEGKMSVSV